MYKYGISLFLMLSLLHVGHAQKKQAWVEAANHAFAAEKDYYKAFKYYETALKYEKDTSDVLYLLYRKAESARLINAYLDAQQAYQELIRRAPVDSLAKITYRCALAYLGDLQLSRAYSGNTAYDPALYEKALASFAAYEQLTPAAPCPCDEQVSRGKAMIRFATQGDGLQLTNELVQVESAGPNINSGFSDFAPLAWGGRLYFTSFRRQVMGKGTQLPRYFSRIYVSNQVDPAMELPIINLTPNDTLHVGHSTFNRNRDRIYFTRCEYINGTLNTHCDLYYHQLNNQGEPIGAAVEVSELNQKNSTLTQPAMGWDPRLQREILYFASNRPGSRGGMDIWKSEWVDGHFTAPTNDLLINTKGNEMTPFYQNGLLYFSSDELPERYGGYDIFFTADPKNEKPVNLGQKINSSADELYYSRNEEGTIGYLSSNRVAASSSTPLEGKPDDLEAAGSLDIYYYQIREPLCRLQVSTFSQCALAGQNSEQALEGVSLSLFDITDGAEPAGIAGIAPASHAENQYRFDELLRPNRKYLIVGALEGFEVQRHILDFTGNRKPCANGMENLVLYFHCAQPILQVQVYHHDQEVREAIVRIVAMPDSTQNENVNPTQKTVSGLQIPCQESKTWSASYPGEKSIKAFTGEFPLLFDQNYLIIVDSGLPDSLLWGTISYQPFKGDAAFCGTSCRDTLRINLEALPTVPLFFENGAPGPHPYDVAGSSYLMTLDRYKNRKNAYLEQLPADNELAVSQTQRADLELFFSQELDNSHLVLYEFAQQATELLCRNIPITIEAKGCNTPPFFSLTQKQTTFMKHLVNRRIDSVQQDLIGLGLSKDRWPDIYGFEPISQACEGASPTPGINQNEDWLERETSSLAPFSIHTAKNRRVELKLKIGRKTEN